MDKVPSSIDEGLQQMQTEARARGLLHLITIFGSFYTREQLLSALEAYSLNVEEASIFLQDNLPFMEQIKLPESGQNEELVEFAKENIEKPEAPSEIETVEGPKEGKIALEFSLSHVYINSEVPVFYIIDEIVKHIFSFLQAGERAKLASVCRTFKMIDEKTEYLYKRDCNACWAKPFRPENIFFTPYDRTAELWGAEYPKAYTDTNEYLKTFKTWRNMYVKRPKIRTNGVYISRVVYFKQGQVNMDNLPTYHKIVFFRYLRFYSDFSVCCMNTAKKPREIFRLVDKNHKEARLGEWARALDQLTIHLIAKDEVFTYKFKMQSSSPDLQDTLKLLSIGTRSRSNTEFCPLSINNDAWPKYFKFYSF